MVVRSPVSSQCLAGHDRARHDALSRRAFSSALGVSLISLPSHPAAAVQPQRQEMAWRDGWQDLDLTNQHIVTRVEINSVPCLAIVDSGAQRSVIRPDFAEKLQLKAIRQVAAVTFTQVIEGSLFEVNSLKFGKFIFNKVDMSSYHISDAQYLMPEEVMVIIGMDILHGIVLDIDFVDRKMRIGERLDIQNADKFRMEKFEVLETGLPTMKIALEAAAYVAAVDLGNSAPILISGEFAEQRGLFDARPTSTAMSVGAEGSSIDRIFSARTVRFVGHEMRDVPIRSISNWQFPVPLVIGWQFFRAFYAIFDFITHRGFFRASQNALSTSFPKDRSGLGVQRFADHLLVSHVAAGSPAWRAGIQPGDAIVELDDVPVGPDNPKPGVKLGQLPAGSKIKLGLSSGRQVILVLKDYF